MLFDLERWKYRPSGPLDHFVFEPQHPISQVFPLLGVRMIILAMPLRGLLGLVASDPTL